MCYYTDIVNWLGAYVISLLGKIDELIGNEVSLNGNTPLADLLSSSIFSKNWEIVNIIIAYKTLELKLSDLFWAVDFVKGAQVSISYLMLLLNKAIQISNSGLQHPYRIIHEHNLKYSDDLT